MKKNKNLKKRGHLAFTAALLCLSFAYAASWAADEIKDFSKATEFNGVIVPEVTMDIPYGFNDEYRGIITYTARAGLIFSGPEVDIEGKILKKGDPIIRMDTKYAEAKLKEKEALLDQAKASLQLAEQDYVRNTKLIKTSSVSKQAYEQAKATYLGAKAAVVAAEAQVIFRKEILALCTYNAQFDGIVNQVYFSTGVTAGGEPNIINISQLSPIGVQIDMDRTLANQITPSTPVTVYPMPEVSGEPVGIVLGSGYLTDTGIMLELGNFPLEINKVENGKSLPHVHEINVVTPAHGDPMAINSRAIFKDDKGTYVWKAVGQKNMQPGSTLDSVFPVKKVYVTLANKQYKFSPDNIFATILPNQDIQAYDMIVMDVPEGTQDGAKVIYAPKRYIFMPGDKVKVVIGPNEPNTQN